MSPNLAVNLTPPFHPLPTASQGLLGGRFLLHCPCRRRQLSVRKYAALCCPDFPSCRYVAASDRPRFCVIMLIQFGFQSSERFSPAFCGPICMNPLMAYTIRHMPVITVTMFSIPLGLRKSTAMPGYQCQPRHHVEPSVDSERGCRHET